MWQDDGMGLGMSGERRRKRNHVEFVTRSKNGKPNGEKTYVGTTNLV